MKEISFEYQGTALRGILIQERDGQATVKLSSGYNIIIPSSEMHDVKIQEITQAMHETALLHQDSSLPKVTILHTGGTIASKVDYATGAVTNRFKPEELLGMFPELLKIAHIESRLLRNMASDDMRFAHYNILARAVLEEIGKNVHGVIITHGTDTLHYSAAALSFALEGLTIPVVIVGSQRSSDRGSSDASTNLRGALTFITQCKAPGVFVAMHETSSDDSIAIIDGLHARKNHSSRRDAFGSVNAPLVGRVTEGVEIIDAQRMDEWKSYADKTSVKPFEESLKVGLWKAHTQSYAEELAPYDTFDGLLIEGTGLGHIPMSETDEFTLEHTRIKEKVAHLAKHMPVAIATQTIYGRVDLNVYAPQRQLQEMGVLGNGCDMAPEIAFIKLAWLISNHPKDVRSLYGKNLRGEISKRSPLESSHNQEKC